MNVPLLTSPLLHFLLIGAVLAWCHAERWGAERITVESARIEAKIHAWRQLTGRLPNKRERQLLIDEIITDEVLHREALSRRLDLLPVAVNRLVQLADFLQLTDPEASDKDKYRAALALELDKTDPVVRRYVVDTLRRRLQQPVTRPSYSPEAIRDHYLSHSEQFWRPAHYRLSHVFIGGTGKRSQRRAEKLQRRLLADGATATSAETLGDVFYNGHQLPLLSEAKIATRMGSDFARQVPTLRQQQWSAPIRSAYGWHLVWVHQSLPEGLPPLTTVRAEIVERLYAQQRSTSLAQNLDELRRQYRIEVPTTETANGGRIPYGS